MNYGFVRVAAVVPKLTLADCIQNSKEIIELVQEGVKREAQVMVFPELSITGYTCADLFHQQLLLDKAQDGLKMIIKSTQNTDITVIVGLPIMRTGMLFNCAVVIHNGKILGAVPKSHIPNYGEFYEKRWFAAAVDLNFNQIQILDDEVLFGVDLIFKMGKTGARFGIELCEDLWVPNAPSSRQALAGANILFNLSASNDLIGKFQYRHDLVKMQSAKCIAAYVYASSGVGESSTDTVFGGHSIIAENGNVLAEGERFKSDSRMIIADVDVQRLTNERFRNSRFNHSNETKEFREISYETFCKKPNKLLRKVDAHPFVPSETKELSKRCEEIFAIQTTALARRIRSSGAKTVVIGISGGLDSTLALLVATKTFDDMEIERNKIIAVTMPGFGTTDETKNNAIDLMNAMEVTIKEVNIVKACIQHFEDIGHDITVHDTTYENVQARERTQILMDIANKESGLVIGTGDMSELALGWCTYNGDHMSMYAVNCGVPKTLVKFLVEWVADSVIDKNTGGILHKIIETPISPELLPPSKTGEIQQKTESIIGPYELHDFFMYHMLRYGAEPQKILFLAETAFDGKYEKSEILKYLKLFYRRFFSQQFKRSCIPDGPKVGTISLSPRSDWRMPSDVQGSMWLDELEEF